MNLSVLSWKPMYHGKTNELLEKRVYGNIQKKERYKELKDWNVFKQSGKYSIDQLITN